MNDFPLNDPGLQSLEAQLAGLVPQLSPNEQRKLLYQCAFVAGKQSAVGKVWRWKAVSAALAVVACVMTIPLINREHPQASVDKKVDKTVFSVTSEGKPEPLPNVAAVSLDAWQSPRDSLSTTFDGELTRFRQLDTTSRSHSLAALGLSLNPSH